MADNLLAICQEVSDKLQIESPAAIMNSTNETSRIFRACAKDEVEDLLRAPEKPWTASIREHTFVTVSGTPDYALPASFKYFIDQTVWDRANYWEMRGPISQAEWQAVKSSILANTVTSRKRYQLRSNGAAAFPTVRFYLSPTPTVSNETLVYEYVSTATCYNVITGAPQETWLQDTDLPILDQYLIKLGITWRVLSRFGLPYDEEILHYETQRDLAIARDGGAKVLSLARSRSLGLIDANNVPDTGFG